MGEIELEIPRDRNGEFDPSIQALNKELYLSTRRITKNWTSKVPKWGECLRELEIMYEGRI